MEGVMAETKKVPVEKTTKAAAPAPTPSAGGGSHPLMTLRDEVDRVFDDFFRGWPSLMSFPSRLFDFDPFKRMGEPLVPTFGALAPKVDVSETPDSYQIEAELPGMDEKDINVTLSDGMLTIKGEKKSEREEKKKDYYLSERSYGTVQRSFSLPETVDPDKISAAFAKGVLTLSLPKTKEARAKQRTIEIKSK
jgi:HSP20 family protein